MSLSLNPRWIAAGGIVLAVLLLAASIAAYRWAASIYDSNFDQRYTTSPADAFVIEDFPYLHRTRHTFTSNDGQMLVGYFYNNPLLSARKKAVVIAFICRNILKYILFFLQRFERKLQQRQIILF